jgi:Protein-disulfide isomerase
MRYNLRKFSVFIFVFISTNVYSQDMTLNELFFDDSKPFHIKIIEALPKHAIIQVGPDNAENTVIEFMDYFCGYCKKIQPELIDLANRRSDTRVIFLQYPILSENSKLVSEMVIAANFQNKGTELHNGLFSMSGNLTQEKLDQLITDLDINRTKLRIDMGKDEVKNIIKLSSFLAMGSGARGTPSLFFNEEFLGGYVPINQLERFLK